MTAADIALAMLRDPALLTFDHGATIRRLAQRAGVKVRWVHVDLQTLESTVHETGPDTPAKEPTE